MRSEVVLFPLLSAVAYAFSAACSKRAIHPDFGPWPVLFVTNLVTGAGLALLWFIGPTPATAVNPGPPMLAGSLFFLGQVFTFLAIDRGDVSVTTPLLGIKVFLVAVFTTALLAEPVPSSWWVASAMTFAAMGLLGGGPPGSKGRLLPSILLAALGATAYALSDITVQRFGSRESVTRFLPLMFATNAALSLGVVPFFRRDVRRMPRSTWGWSLAGAGLFALAALGMAWTISSFGQATAANVVYAARGVLAVLLVWLAGPLLGTTEHEIGHAHMIRRLGAAMLVVAAISLAVFAH